MRLVLFACCLLSGPLAAQVPTLVAPLETDPIPAGFSHSDDAAVWQHPSDPSKTIILGTSKYGKNQQGGLGVYGLDGHQRQFFAGSKLNSVDIVGQLAVASNRSEKALDIYSIDDGQVSFTARTILRDEAGQSFEPYGLCLATGAKGELSVYLPTKSGKLYHYALDAAQQARLLNVLDLSRFVSEEDDRFLQETVRKSAIADGDADEVQEELDERFILEGCAYDAATQKLFVGMENFGIWSLDTREAEPQPELAVRVEGSWADIENWQTAGRARITDDIEGIDILHVDGRSILIFSSQGISEFSLYDVAAKEWIGNFKVSYGAEDPVSKTDGLAVKSGWLSAAFPEGVLVVHDDQNEQGQGTIAPANYKVVSLGEVYRLFNGGLKN